MSAFSRMPAVPESARNSLTNGRRNVATPIAAQRLHERSLWLGGERARVVASSVMAEGWEITPLPLEEDRELGLYRLPPVGNDTGVVTVRVLIVGIATGHVYAVPTDDAGTATGGRVQTAFAPESGVPRWVPVPFQLQPGTTAIRVGVHAVTGEAFAVSVVVDTSETPEMTDGIEAPTTWPKLSALFFEAPDIDHSYDVNAIQRTASQHAHIVGRMPRTLVARSMLASISNGEQAHNYRLRVSRSSRPLRVLVLACFRGFGTGSISVRTGKAASAQVGALAPAGPTLIAPPSATFEWFEIEVPASAAAPDAVTSLLDVQVVAEGEEPGSSIGGVIAVKAIRIEQLPSSMEDYDVTDGGRYACAPVRAIPADRFLPGDPVIDSFRLGSMQRMWSDRRTAVSNALFRAVDHLCVHVSDWFAVIETGSDPSDPQETDDIERARVIQGLRYNQLNQQWTYSSMGLGRSTPHAQEVVGLLPFPPLPAVPFTTPLTALQTRHTVSDDASEVVVMSRLWIENEGYGQRIWVSLWRDGLEVVPARPFEGHERGWREVGRVPVVPGETHDLEMKVALGDEQGPFDYLLPGPTILIPGIVAWEIPTEASPSRVYWHGAVDHDSGANILDLVVPESRDFDIRKIRVRVVRDSDGGLNVALIHNPGEITQKTVNFLWGDYPADAWFSDWRIGDMDPTRNPLTPFVGDRSAGVWRIECNPLPTLPKFLRFELELE